MFGRIAVRSSLWTSGRFVGELRARPPREREEPQSRLACHTLLMPAMPLGPRPARADVSHARQRLPPDTGSAKVVNGGFVHGRLPGACGEAAAIAGIVGRGGRESLPGWPGRGLFEHLPEYGRPSLGVGQVVLVLGPALALKLIPRVSVPSGRARPQRFWPTGISALSPGSDLEQRSATRIRRWHACPIATGEHQYDERCPEAEVGFAERPNTAMVSRERRTGGAQAAPDRNLWNMRNGDAHSP